MAPVLIKVGKELAKDPRALAKLDMDRTTASYKMRFGLARTFHDRNLSNLQNSFFSLNIDESTSANLHRVLAVLVSYFSPSAKEIVVEHLTSFSVHHVDAQSLYNELLTLFEEKNIPWNNLVSILMDSCAVMRGSKSGVETRIRQGKAPHLLDIDGDVCHHIHNIAQKFCKPFAFWVEGMYMDIFTDVKWSVDLRDILQEISFFMGIKFTMPERLITHRWLSAYDVTVSTLRMWEPLTVFYYGFLLN